VGAALDSPNAPSTPLEEIRCLCGRTPPRLTNAHQRVVLPAPLTGSKRRTGFILLAVVIAIATPETGALEKGALFLLGTGLVWLASRVRQISTRPA
jgi:hypothetical protein